MQYWAATLGTHALVTKNNDGACETNKRTEYLITGNIKRTLLIDDCRLKQHYNKKIVFNNVIVIN